VNRNETWKLYKAGDTKAAIEQFQTDCIQSDSYQAIANLGLAYFFSGQLDDAKCYLDKWSQCKAPRMDSAYVWAGVVRWVLNHPEEACQVWRSGLDCEYRDPAGGVTLPLLLYFAACIYSDKRGLTEATSLIVERTATPRATNWPGPIGHFVTGSITEDELIARAADSNSQLRVSRQMQMVHSYLGVHSLLEGSRSKFTDRLNRCTQIEESRFEPEGILARFEMRLPLTFHSTSCGLNNS
jgi:hypothetical protein